jgi:uncharacterized glyoxalase superfamily protein PhnB
MSLRGEFHGAIPILRVRALATSLAHYVDVLGFRQDWCHEGVFAQVSRGRCALMLCEGDQGQPGTWVWIGVDDAAALYQELRNAGADIPLPPTNYPWAYELHVRDPDGHVLRMGSATRQDKPLAHWHAWYARG